MGARLRGERNRLGYNIRAFAKLGGVSSTAQSNYENDISRPDAEYLNRISSAGAEIFWIMRGLPEDDALRDRRIAQYPPEIREMNENYELASPAVQAAVRSLLKDAAEKKRAEVAEFKRAHGSSAETDTDHTSNDKQGTQP